MFLREQQGWDVAGGGGRGFGRAPVPAGAPSRADRWRAHLLRIDLAPDLGSRIGSRDWWRGLVTCTALIGAGWMLGPTFKPLPEAVPAPLSGDEWAEARDLAIAPLARGGDTGRRMAANDLVRPLTDVPERPQVELTATLGDGDRLADVLARAGVGQADADAVAADVFGAVAPGDLRAGTRLDLTLGRRPNRTVARPLEKLAFRARFDLDLSLARTADGALAMTRQAIAVDHTPLVIEGIVAGGLYRSTRAAGAPANVVEDYIRAVAGRISIGQDVAPGDRFRLVIERARAATGEVQIGRLLFAGLTGGTRKVELVRWQQDGHEDWFDANGQIRRAGAMEMPVAGHVTSAFGWRFHPILGFTRMHKGVDIGAPYGSPIAAAIDGTVLFAGWHGGHGKFVELAHGGNITTGYGHMSRIAVQPGEHVRRGQVIGYVGMTGLTTGPHLHWEVIKNGVAINPLSIRYASLSSLPDADMRGFKARVASLLAVAAGK
jgi:murein DD-endopeptidase MepM/ murein hydrolase activator NlpD